MARQLPLGGVEKTGMAKKTDSKASPMLVKENTEIRLNRIAIVEGRNFRHDIGSDESIRALADSIAKEGLLQPVTVSYNPDANTDKPYTLEFGHRRFAAVTLLGHTTIKAQLAVFATDLDRDMAAAAENMARDDLSSYDVAHMFVSFRDRFGFSGAQLSKRMSRLLASGRKPYGKRHINKLTAAADKLVPEIQVAWRDDTLPVGLQTLLSWAPLSADEQSEMYDVARGVPGKAPGGDEPKSKGPAKPRKAAEKNLIAALEAAEQLNSSEAKAIASALGFALGRSVVIKIANAVVYDATPKPKAKKVKKAKKAKKAKKVKKHDFKKDIKAAKKATRKPVVRKKR